MFKASFVVLLFTSFSFAQVLEPGIWQADTNFKLNGVPMPESKNRECVSTAQATDIKGTLSKELKKHGCSIIKWTAKGKQVEIAIQCDKSGLVAKGNLRGTVEPKNYNLSGEAEGTFQQFPSRATVSLQGKWLKSCPKI